MKRLARATIVVEGDSDRRTLLAVARRLGRDLDSERIGVRVVGGAGGFAEALDRLVADHPQNHRLAGLCDEDAWITSSGRSDGWV